MRSESPALDRPSGDVDGQRKLIRPSLDRAAVARPGMAKRREAPPETTGAEEAWLSRAVSAGSAVEIRLETGESLKGQIEWTDRDCLKLRRRGAEPVVVMKRAIVSLTADVASPRRG